MPSSPPSNSTTKNCVRCNTSFTITDGERERMTRAFGRYVEPKTCPDCRRKKRKYVSMSDHIALLHAFAFGYCNTDTKVEYFTWLSQQVVLLASEAGVLDGRTLHKPVGKAEIDARLAEVMAKNKIKLVNDWGHCALPKRHATADLSEIEGELRRHVDAIQSILKEYFDDERK